MKHVMEAHLISHIFYTISSMHLVNDGYDALKTMLLAVYSHFVHTLIFIFFHLFHSFSLAINYLHITCKGFHYRGKFARNDYILAGLKTFLYSHNMNQRLVYNVTIHFSKIIKLTKIYCVDE